MVPGSGQVSRSFSGPVASAGEPADKGLGERVGGAVICWPGRLVPASGQVGRSVDRSVAVAGEPTGEGSGDRVIRRYPGGRPVKVPGSRSLDGPVAALGDLAGEGSGERAGGPVIGAGRGAAEASR
jgi:hypothetical protein